MMNRLTGFSLLLISLFSLTVDANFFSRLLTYGDSPSENSPTGARSATGSTGQVGSVVSFSEGVLMAHLSNNNRIPLVGVGVGHSPHKFVGPIVSEAIQDNKRIRLIDTASASKNEAIVAKGILAGAAKLGQDEKLEVHVVTKVWYTHLGYERTKLSIEQSLKALEPAIQSDKVDLKIHFMLNWPRCYEGISWMDCASEEASLDSFIKNTGPDPTKDPDAWKESWKYLEDIYMSGKYPIESIGLSNFILEDIEKMESFARISPQVLQVSLWSLLNDSDLIEYCHKNRIHLQVFNAMQGTVAEPGRAPHAYHHIQKVALELSSETGLTVTPAQTMLAWLVQHGISVIPRTSRLTRLEENSAVVLSTIPALSDQQIETVAHGVEALLTGNDMEKDLYATVTFHAMHEDLMLYWVQKDGSELRIDHIRKGEAFNETTYPNHVYRTYNAYNKDIYAEHQVDVNFGEHKHVYVDKFDHDESQMPHDIPSRSAMARDSE